MTDTPNKDDKATDEPLVLTDQASEEKAAAEATAAPAEKEPAEVDAVAPPRRPKAWLAGSLALIALAVAIAGSYIGHQQLLMLQDSLAKQQGQVSDALGQIAASRDDMAALAKQLQGASRANNGVVSQLNSLADIVANNQRRIDEVSGTERSDWQLAEAEYLLRLASQRLMMSGEVRGSKALLQAADNVLLELDDVALIAVRQAIAADLAALNRADSLDIEGLYLRVAALASNLDYLQLRSAKQWHSAAAAMEPVAEEASLWQSGLQKALATLSNLVVVRRAEQRVLPQMSDVEVLQLQQGLHYLVEQAKYAVITGKQPLYDMAIANLQRWILDYYDAEENTTGAMLSELQLLSDARVSQAWPDISGSLNALKMVMQDRLGLPSRDSAQSSQQGAPQ